MDMDECAVFSFNLLFSQVPYIIIIIIIMNIIKVYVFRPVPLNVYNQHTKIKISALNKMLKSLLTFAQLKNTILLNVVQSQI
jgi:hypothetical protein